MQGCVIAMQGCVIGMLAWNGHTSFCNAGGNTNQTLAAVVWELAGIIKAGHSGFFSFIERGMQG